MTKIAQNQKEIHEDKVGIESFLQSNEGKKVILVQGLGFVGAVMSLVCANALTEEYAVIGVDLPTPLMKSKIERINSGTFPIISSDPKIKEYYNVARKKNNFYATFDPYAYSCADIIIVDVNLDVQKKSNSQGDLEKYDVNLNPFKSAISTIANNCKEDVLVLVETTVPPGTCQKIVNNIMQEGLKQRGKDNSLFRLGHSYERVMPGPDYIDSIQNFYRVYSGIDERSADATETFLRTIISTDEYPLTRLGNTTATEMAKVLENSYRAMNIAFAVEWSRFAEEAGVNLYEVVRAIRKRPTHKNLMLPGIGVGGYCLTKDPLMASWAKTDLFDGTNGLPQSETGVRINDKMPHYAYDFMRGELETLNVIGKDVLLLGVSYRSDVGDSRYSPVEPFYRRLMGDNYNVQVHDPYINHWEELDLKVVNDMNACFTKELDVIIISTGHSQYKKSEALMKHFLSQESLFILDTVGLLSEEEIILLSKKHTVRVVGRGDIL